MADKKKEEVPEHISKFYKLQKKADQMLTTMHRHHRGAYDKAIDDVLTKDGQVDMELLEDSKIQDKFANVMADQYISKAKKLFKTGDDAKFDDLEKELLMNAYTGTTKTQLLHLVKTHKKGFTFEHFYGKEVPGMTKKIKDNLDAAASSHITEESLDDILKYTGADKHIKKDILERGHGIALLDIYKQMGTISPKMIEDQFGKKYLKKK
ncbi:MAG TPA: hypothetical protein VJG31_01005 [Candidatus Nanoarchaeia archaeon]|nr:hypothetical protein [Candidatus Nanoarchaeia archaeon]